MKKGLLLLAFSLLTSAIAVAEPTNLTVVKQNLMRYHDSGEYMRELAAVDAAALRYLKQRLAHMPKTGKKPAIVLDIDETSLSNYPHMVWLDFGGTLDEIRHAEDEAIDPAIQPTLNLYRYAKAAHVAIFFVTGRYTFEREATARNLAHVGYQQWDGLFLKPTNYRYKSIIPFKSAVRKELSSLGYEIILNIGDQFSDLKGGYADKTFKLPNPYYYLP